MPTLGELLDRKPTYTDEKATNLWIEIGNNEAKWIPYMGVKGKLERVKALAETFVAHHSYLKLSYDEMYTSEPLGVFWVNDMEPLADIRGVFYANGAVVRMISGDRIVYLLWIDSKTVEIFGYPDTIGEP